MWIFVQDGLYSMEKIKNFVSLGYTTNNKNVMTFLSDEKYTIVQHLFVKSKTKTITPTHTHDYYELEVLIGGKAIEIVNGMKYEAEPGDFVLLSQSDTHNVDYVDDIVVFLVIKIQQGIFSPKLNRILETIDFPAVGKLNEEELDYIGVSIEKMQKAKEKIHDKVLFDDIMCGMLENLLLYIIGINNEIRYKEYSQSKSKNMIDAIVYLRKNYNQDISLKELAERFGYSCNYFGNKFKEITGKSFVDYLNDMRLLNAFNKIATSDMPLEDISGEVGYENFSYFYRKFKQKYGFTPGTLRKNKNKTKK